MFDLPGEDGYVSGDLLWMPATFDMIFSSAESGCDFTSPRRVALQVQVSDRASNLFRPKGRSRCRYDRHTERRDGLVDRRQVDSGDVDARRWVNPDDSRTDAAECGNDCVKLCRVRRAVHPERNEREGRLVCGQPTGEPGSPLLDGRTFASRVRQAGQELRELGTETDRVGVAD